MVYLVVGLVARAAYGYLHKKKRRKRKPHKPNSMTA